MTFETVQVKPKRKPLTPRATMTVIFGSIRCRWSHGRLGFDEVADDGKVRPESFGPAGEDDDEQLAESGVSVDAIIISE